MIDKPSTVPAKRMAHERDLIIAELHAQFRSLDYIHQELINRGIYNPETNLPYARSTVAKIITQKLPQIYKSIYKSADPDEYRFKQLAEIESIKKEAHASGQIKSVLKAIEIEAKITGTFVHERDLPVDLKILWDFVTELTKKKINPEQMLLSMTEQLKLDTSHVLELNEPDEIETSYDDAEYSEIIEVSENEFIS